MTVATLQCPRCLWVYEKGTYHDCNDEMIGSLLEYWLMRDTGARCRFDNKPLPIADGVPPVPANRFCGPGCKEAWEKVREARIVISARDLHRRGFD